MATRKQRIEKKLEAVGAHWWARKEVLNSDPWGAAPTWHVAPYRDARQGDLKRFWTLSEVESWADAAAKAGKLAKVGIAATVEYVGEGQWEVVAFP